MKVLWFTLSPSLASASLNQPGVGRGWIESLQEQVLNIENINLAVAFVDGEEKVKKFSLANTNYYAIPHKKTKIRGLIDRHLARVDNDKLINYCLEIVNDFQPDVIHIFGTEDAFGLIADKIKVPVVIHMQGLLTVYQRKWFAPGVTNVEMIRSSSLRDIARGNTLFHFYSSFKKWALREQQIFKTGKYFIGRTDWDKRVCSVLSPHATYFYGSEILRKAFYSSVWQLSNRENKIFISTIQANIYKGLETVLESAVLLTQINKFNFTWHIAGISETDSIVGIFERKVGKKFKDYNVILSGKLMPDALLPLELQADIFIHPSHIDNSPNSVCEAMLLGMPVIATFTGGTGSLLTDRKEGLLIQDGDPYAMAGAVVELIGDPQFAMELGKNARIRALERHNPETIVNNLINIYTTVTRQ